MSRIAIRMAIDIFFKLRIAQTFEINRIIILKPKNKMKQYKFLVQLLYLKQKFTELRLLFRI